MVNGKAYIRRGFNGHCGRKKLDITLRFFIATKPTTADYRL